MNPIVKATVCGLRSGCHPATGAFVYLLMLDETVRASAFSPQVLVISLRSTQTATVAVAIAFCLSAPPLVAQGRAVLRGRVLVDGSDKPISGAEVSLPRLLIVARTDTSGAFRLGDIPAGRHQLSVRRVGFVPLTTLMIFAAGDSVEADLLLSSGAAVEGQPLPGVTVMATPTPRGRLAEFEERRAMGAGGRFLTQAQLDLMEGRRMSEALATISVPVVIGRSDAAWVASSRGTQSLLRIIRPSMADLAMGAKTHLCYAAVALDGVLVYSGGDSEPLFDINTLSTKYVAGVEFYAGPATMPAKYNGTRTTCGLILIWTR